MLNKENMKFIWDGEEYCSVSILVKERGWSKSLITRYLGNPCRVIPNPHYRGAAPMKLYLKSLVLEIEQLNGFIQDKAKAEKISLEAKDRLSGRVQKNMEVLSNYEISKFDITYPELISRAKRSVMKRSKFNKGILNLQHVEAIMAIGILYEKTSPSMYVIDDSFGSPGVKAMRKLMRTKILNSIKENFPELSEVCLVIENRVDLSCPTLDFDALAKLDS